MIALIAGRGRLPEILAATLSGRGEKPLVAALQGQGPETLSVDLSFRLEHLGSFLDSLRARGITGICLAGGIERPALDPGQVDAATMPFVPIFMQALGQGDDGALRAVLKIFEQAGFTVLAAHEICPDLLPSAGVLAGAEPDGRLKGAAERGMQVIAAMGAADIGQACVVRGKAVLAVEATPGTDWMLASLSGLSDEARAGGALIKSAKPLQDLRADMPAIGPDTIRAAADAGLGAVVVTAGNVMVLDRAATIAAAEEQGLTLWVRDVSG